MIAETPTPFKSEDLQELTVALGRYVHAAAREGRRLDEVQKAIWEQLRQIGRQALDQFLADQGNGDLGETFTMPDGRVLNRLGGLHRRSYQSIVGRFGLDRVAYGSREGQKIEFVPLDQRLGLPESGFSYVLQEWNQALGVEHAFGRVDETIQMILGFRQSVDTLERTNRHMAGTVDAFRRSRPADARPAGTHRTKGEKANKKQMATVGVVYTVDPKVRAAEDVVAALFRDARRLPERPDQPKAHQKRVWSSLSMERDGHVVRGQDEVFGWLAEDYARRNPEDLKEVVCLMDGQPSLWADRLRYLPIEAIVEILDLLHVTPRLWEAAHVFHGEGSREASAFVRERLLGILEGRVGYVIGGLPDCQRCD